MSIGKAFRIGTIVAFVGLLAACKGDSPLGDKEEAGRSEEVAVIVNLSGPPSDLEIFAGDVETNLRLTGVKDPENQVAVPMSRSGSEPFSFQGTVDRESLQEMHAGLILRDELNREGYFYLGMVAEPDGDKLVIDFTYFRTDFVLDFSQCDELRDLIRVSTTPVTTGRLRWNGEWRWIRTSLDKGEMMGHASVMLVPSTELGIEVTFYALGDRDPYRRWVYSSIIPPVEGIREEVVVEFDEDDRTDITGDSSRVER